MADDKPTLTKYWEMLDCFDWHYGDSDDHGVYKGCSAYDRHLQAIADQDPDYRRLYDTFKQHYLSGPLFGTPRAPKPPHP